MESYSKVSAKAGERKLNIHTNIFVKIPSITRFFNIQIICKPVFLMLHFLVAFNSYQFRTFSHRVIKLRNVFVWRLLFENFKIVYFGHIFQGVEGWYLILIATILIYIFQQKWREMEKKTGGWLSKTLVFNLIYLLLMGRMPRKSATIATNLVVISTVLKKRLLCKQDCLF